MAKLNERITFIAHKYFTNIIYKVPARVTQIGKRDNVGRGVESAALSPGMPGDRPRAHTWRRRLGGGRVRYGQSGENMKYLLI